MGVVVARPAARKRLVWLAVAAGAAVVLLVFAIAFANSYGAGRVADNARALHWTNATLGTAALTRAAVVQAATVAELSEIGLVTTEDLEAAMDEAEAAYGRLDDLEAGSGLSPSASLLKDYLETVEDAITALDGRDLALASATITGQLEPAYVDLSTSLEADQDAITKRIDAATKGAARIGDVLRFLITLLIPAVALVFYRTVAKRQLREHQVRVDLELDAERSINRAKDELIAGLSHELRTPLTSIYGFAEILSDSPDDPGNTRDIAHIISSESAELTRMVDDLLAVARLESGGLEIEMTATSVADVIRGATEQFVKAGSELRITGPPAVVLTDAARLRHVLVNLLSNAHRHGGPTIGVEVSTDGEMVEISVWDDGIGVPEDKVENLFQPFVHSGRSTLLTGSLGLGLAVAHRLTGLLGGELAYERYNNQTYFVVRLPGTELETETETISVAETIRAMSA